MFTKTRSIGPVVLMTGLSVIPVNSNPNVPQWWTDMGITGPSSNKSPANIGQLKNMANRLRIELDEELPGGAGFALTELFPEKPDPAPPSWYAEQYKPANLGQLKYVASYFYDRLNTLAPDWVADQMDQNGIDLNTWPHSVPWDPYTPVEENYAIATLGQLKMVFSLRTVQDLDLDGISDLHEHIFWGSTTNDLTTDYDRDGLTDFEELENYDTNPFLSDHDGDGIADGMEISLGLDPFNVDHPQDWNGANAVVLTPTE